MYGTSKCYEMSEELLGLCLTFILRIMSSNLEYTCIKDSLIGGCCISPVRHQQHPVQTVSLLLPFHWTEVTPPILPYFVFSPLRRPSRHDPPPLDHTYLFRIGFVGGAAVATMSRQSRVRGGLARSDRLGTTSDKSGASLRISSTFMRRIWTNIYLHICTIK